MTLKENKNFESISIYKTIPLKEILSSTKTSHMKEERLERYSRSIKCLDKNDYIEHTFLIDKGHKDGKELHSVTHSGLIFIMNENKYINGRPCFITVLLARPNQVKRLYHSCGFRVDDYTYNKCRTYVDKNMNV